MAKADSFDAELTRIAPKSIGPQMLTGEDAVKLEKVIAKIKSGELNWKARGVPRQLHKLLTERTAMTCGEDRFRVYIQQRLGE